MADQLLEQVRDFAEGQIDFEGQRLVEFLITALITAIGVVAFVAGYFLQDIKRALFIGLGGTALTFLLVVPPWPFYKRHPVKWLTVGGGKGPSSQGIVVDGQLVA